MNVQLATVLQDLPQIEVPSPGSSATAGPQVLAKMKYRWGATEFCVLWCALRVQNGRVYSFESRQVAESPQCAVLSSLAACSALVGHLNWSQVPREMGKWEWFFPLVSGDLMGIEKLESQFR